MGMVVEVPALNTRSGTCRTPHNPYFSSIVSLTLFSVRSAIFSRKLNWGIILIASAMETVLNVGGLFNSSNLRVSNIFSFSIRIRSASSTRFFSFSASTNLAFSSSLRSLSRVAFAFSSFRRLIISAASCLAVVCFSSATRLASSTRSSSATCSATTRAFSSAILFRSSRSRSFLLDSSCWIRAFSSAIRKSFNRFASFASASKRCRSATAFVSSSICRSSSSCSLFFFCA